MKKITFILLGLLAFASASAVEYQYSPLVKEGKKWVYFDTRNPCYFYVGYLQNTTEMNGHNYVNYYIQEGMIEPEMNIENAQLAAFFREEDKRVYCVYYYWEEIDNQIYYTPYEYAKYFDEATGENVIYDFNNVTDPYINHYNDDLPLFEGLEVVVAQEQLGDFMSNFYNIGEDVVIAERCGAVKDYLNNDMMLKPFNHRYPNDNLLYRKLAYIEEDGEIIYKGENYDAAMEYLNSSAISTVSGDKQVASVRYYNLTGVESAEPQQGVNIKVTTYSDGARLSEKVIK
jgi:hypothetical protein